MLARWVELLVPNLEELMLSGRDFIVELTDLDDPLELLVDFLLLHLC